MLRLALSAAVALVSLATPALAAEPGGHPPMEMEAYYVAFLFKGDKWTPEKTPVTEAIQKGHMENIQRLADTKKLILAGPFSDGGDLRGMFVFRVASLEEAKALCDTDPAVQAGRLRIELHPWWSAKGIGIVAPEAAHDTLRTVETR